MLYGRSVYRPTPVPQLITRWLDEQNRYYLQHPNLEAHAIFDQYQENYFNEHLFPDDDVLCNDNQTILQGALLKNLLEEFVQQLQSLKRKRFDYKHFTILKQRDYNPKAHSGLVIARFKNYPFVVKLFMETPKAFSYPFSKGFEPCCFFMMSGGISRYLAGFSRVKNREAMQKKIDDSDQWHNKIILPRKWFWKPDDVRWLEISSKNLGPKDQTIKIPSIYAIICDAFDAEPLGMFSQEDRLMGIKLSHFFGPCIDSHINNFLRERSTGKFAVIDTEHFSTMVGLRSTIQFNNYVSWYWQLATKCIGDGYFRCKDKRLFFQKNSLPIVD